MRLLLAAAAGFDYNRTRVIAAGLAEVAPHDHEVFAYGRASQAVGAELMRRAARADVVYVPPFRRGDVAFIRRHAAGRPVLFDPLITASITRVEDYGWWWRRPFARLRDRRDLGRADHLLFDTHAHREWSVEYFGLDPDRCHVLHIGADLSRFRKTDQTPAYERATSQSDPLRVGFYGTYAPLQGAPALIEAAYLLRHRADIAFELIGDLDGHHPEQRAAARFGGGRITYIPYLPYDELAARVAGYDACAGIFGPSVKAAVVIPNKVYHYAALGRPILTRDTPGLREVLPPGEHVLGTTTEPRDIAAAVERLADDSGLRARLGRAAEARMRERFTAAYVAAELLRIARRVAG